MIETFAKPVVHFDDDYQQFLQQMRMVAIIATNGRRYQNNTSNKFVATTEWQNPADFYVFETTVYKFPMNGGLQFNVGLERFKPAHPDHSPYSYERYASIHLSNCGDIDLRAKPCFVPQAEDFEQPIPDPEFSGNWSRAIIKEFFSFNHWLIRGPITSLGPKTKAFLYGFANQAIQDVSTNNLT